MAIQVPQNSFDVQPAAPKSPGIIGGQIQTMSAPAATEQPSVQSYVPQTREINRGTDTTQGQLDSILVSDSPLMQRARTLATQQMAQRGLVNSSMASEAGVAAMIDRAAPIAQSDAQAYDARARENMGAVNAAGQFNAGQANTMTGQRLSIAAEMARQKDQQQFTAGENAADRTQQTTVLQAQQAFTSAQSELDRALQVSQTDKSLAAQQALQTAQQKFSEAQAALDRTQQTTLQATQQQGQVQLQQLQQAFQSAQSELDRAQQTAQTDKSISAQMRLQEAQQKFQEAQAGLDRVQQKDVAQMQIDAQTASQQLQQQFASTQSQLDRDQQSKLAEYQATINSSNVSKEFAATQMTNTLTAINQIQMDPKLKPDAKRIAIQNLMNSANWTLQWGATFYNTPVPQIGA